MEWTIRLRPSMERKKKKNLRQSIVVTVHDVQQRLQCICSTVQFFGVVLVNRDDLNAKHAAASTNILLLAVALNGSNDSLSRTHRTVAYAEPIEMLIHLFFNGHSTSSGGEFRLDHFPGK